jgi:uncharacterized protein YndB with AHSA1/START domain
MCNKKVAYQKVPSKNATMTLHIENDRIDKQIHLKAPRSRVWRALTDYREFSAWFGVNLESPFAAGQTTTGHMTIPGFEHLRLEATVQKLEPEHYFSYTWHPFAVDPAVDYSHETPTLVEFTLEEKDGGTLLAVSESGFANIPAHRRDEAFRMNDGGWSQQLKDIEEHVTSAS